MTRCRICNSALEQVVDLGNQCLGGVFPGPGEPDPPRYPLVLCVCSQCQLLQLRDTVPANLMFGSGYGYRSGVTETMRRHLEGIAQEAVRMLGRTPRRVLDIGCNDGTLLHQFPGMEASVGIDPTPEIFIEDTFSRIHGFFPEDITWHGNRFDLIFSIACFYDSNDPVGFAKAVRANLADDGIWCCEVQDANAMLDGAWDGICHEHLCYYTPATFDWVCSNAGLFCFKRERNTCNGGSLRCWVKKDHTHPCRYDGKMDYSPLAKWVELSRARITSAVMNAAEDGLVHLLGASTKANTWLQLCGLDDQWIEVASDRDPRKHGHRTPGTNIPIVSEEESRAMKPDVYIVGPWSFRNELMYREQAFLARGGKFIMPLPAVEIIGG